MKTIEHAGMGCIHFSPNGECGCTPIPVFTKKIEALTIDPDGHPRPFQACGYIFLRDATSVVPCEMFKKKSDSMPVKKR